MIEMQFSQLDKRTHSHSEHCKYSIIIPLPTHLLPTWRMEEKILIISFWFSINAMDILKRLSVEDSLPRHFFKSVRARLFPYGQFQTLILFYAHRASHPSSESLPKPIFVMACLPFSVGSFFSIAITDTLYVYVSGVHIFSSYIPPCESCVTMSVGQKA